MPIEEICPEMVRAIRQEGFKTWCETMGKSSPDWKLVGTQDIVRQMTDAPHLRLQVGVQDREEKDEAHPLTLVPNPLD